MFIHTCTYTYCNTYQGVKELLVWEPGTSKISIRTSKYFHPMPHRQVKDTVQGYISLNAQRYSATGQVSI